jgi:DNA polymerase-3 subunit gamma/tau
MSYQVLARKYRPQKFSDVIGQEHVTCTLKNAIEQERIAHGYIFSGHRGIGKTTVARILAMALNCRSSAKPIPEPCGVCVSCTEIRDGNSVDVIEIDAATNRGIDEIRELREAARYRPARDRFKIYILDEAHQITDAAFNALLKTLEEPPGHVIFMLATTQPEDIPQTIRSRCQHFSFRAVKFEDIVAQLRQIVDREVLVAQSGVFKTVDRDAYPLIAEAADGSMRDALSVLDQAIASSSGQLTAESVRNLIGAAPAAILENVMQAVAESSSETVLRLVDELLNEGHSPSHFARQMVRFLRNATVAKIAGKDSPLLQISSDERARVARVAELFSEEDLARHLQIMLGTHGELGYRKEQRFHLELGLLKMAHAQRLLPIEQLLSDASLPSGALRPATASRLAASSEARRTESAPPARQTLVSPFAADSARKNTPKAEISAEDSPIPLPAAGNAANVVIMGSTAPALAELATEPASSATPGANVNALRDCVLSALGQQPMLVSMLEAAEWSLEGNSFVARVAASNTMVEMSFNAEARRVASAAASRLAGKPVKVLLQPGGTAQKVSAPRPASSNGSARSRAEQDPIVRRMQEKFGAEIRTVIDYREKG